VRAPNATGQATSPSAPAACCAAALEPDCVGVSAYTEIGAGRRGGMPLGEQLAPHLARSASGHAAIDGRPARARPHSRTPASIRHARCAPAALRAHAAPAARRAAGRNVEDGAVVVLDNASGEVLAWVGSSGDLSGAAEVDGVLARASRARRSSRSSTRSRSRSG
jgi:penicillin-binding protein 1C